MRTLLWFHFSLSLIAPCFAARDYKEIGKLREEGASLSSQQVEELEKKIAQKPKDEESRIRLLSYYATHLPATDAGKADRVKHILWVVDHDPKDGWGLMGGGANMALGVPCMGPGAYPQGYQQVADAWFNAAGKMPGEKPIRAQVVAQSEYCEPQRVERLLRDMDDQAGLARIYSHAVLGMTGASPGSGVPVTTAERRQSAFATRARQKLEEGGEHDFAVTGAVELLFQGARLWAAGQLDWDYTALGKILYDRAIQMDPQDFGLATVPLSLPKPGDEPARVLRVGGNVQAQNLIRKVTPDYPMAAKAAGIRGTVRLVALLDLDGTVLRLRVQEGPPELVQPATDAVRQWVYKPTLLNGKPCYIVTPIDVNFRLQAF